MGKLTMRATQVEFGVIGDRVCGAVVTHAELVVADNRVTTAGQMFDWLDGIIHTLRGCRLSASDCGDATEVLADAFVRGKWACVARFSGDGHREKALSLIAHVNRRLQTNG